MMAMSSCLRMMIAVRKGNAMIKERMGGILEGVNSMEMGLLMMTASIISNKKFGG
jgi:hypothetical protein